VDGKPSRSRKLHAPMRNPNSQPHHDVKVLKDPAKPSIDENRRVGVSITSASKIGVLRGRRRESASMSHRHDCSGAVVEGLPRATMISALMAHLTTGRS